MIVRIVFSTMATLFLVGLCFGQPWLAHPRVILQVGDVPPGGGQRPVFFVSGPVQDGAGKIGLLGHLDNGDGTVESFIWLDDGILLLSSQVNANTFHGRILGIGRLSLDQDPPYAALANDLSGDRVLRSHREAVMTAGGHAPGLPSGAVVQDFRNLQMLTSGRLYFNLNYFSGNQKTAQYVSDYATAGSIRLLFKDGDVVDGATIRRLGLAYEWHISDDGGHHAQIMSVTLQTGENKKAVYHNGELVLLQGDQAGFGETWLDFTRVATTIPGHLLTGGEVDSPSYNDAVLAVKGQIVQREGQVVDGVHLTSPAEVGNIRVDRGVRAIYIWARNGFAGPYAVFFTSDVEDFGSTRHIVSEGAGLDLDGDGSDDAHLHRFRFDGGPTLAFGPNDTIHIAAEVRYENDIVRCVLEYPLR